MLPAKLSTVHPLLPPTCGVQDMLQVARIPALVTLVDQSSILPLVFWRVLFPGVKVVLRLVTLVSTLELVTMLLTSTPTSGLACKYGDDDVVKVESRNMGGRKLVAWKVA